MEFNARPGLTEQALRIFAQNRGYAVRRTQGRPGRYALADVVTSRVRFRSRTLEQLRRWLGQQLTLRQRRRIAKSLWPDSLEAEFRRRLAA